jgi:hypothetical protein
MHLLHLTLCTTRVPREALSIKYLLIEIYNIRVPFSLSSLFVRAHTQVIHHISLSPASVSHNSIMPAQEFELEEDYKSELAAFGQRIKARRDAGL